MKPDLNSNSIITLKKGVALRFEHNFHNGTMILIDTINDKFWLGNKESRTLIQLLHHNQTLSISEIFGTVLNEYDESDYEMILEGLNNIINDLYNKEFLTLCQ